MTDHTGMEPELGKEINDAPILASEIEAAFPLERLKALYGEFVGIFATQIPNGFTRFTFVAKQLNDSASELEHVFGRVVFLWKDENYRFPTNSAVRFDWIVPTKLKEMIWDVTNYQNPMHVYYEAPIFGHSGVWLDGNSVHVVGWFPGLSDMNPIFNCFIPSND